MNHAAHLTAACLAAWVFSTSRIQAAPGDATRLEYARSARAAACPDRSALQAQVRERLGYDPFFHAARQTITVEILDVDGEFRAQMRMTDEAGIIVGSRELGEQAGHCDELVASLALAISIALDPSAALGQAPRVAGDAASASPESAERPPEPERTSVAQDHPQKTRRTHVQRRPGASERGNRFQLAARSSVFADLGTAPATAFGWRLGFDLRGPRYLVAAEFSQQLPSSKELSDGARARASLFAGTLAPCFSSAALAGCASVKLGALQTRGDGIAHPLSQSTFYAALGARFEYSPTLFGKLQVLTQVEVLKPLTPVSLHLLGAEVWSSPVLAFSAGIGLRVHF